MSDRLTALDAQRGLCALFVALLHAQGVSHVSESPFIQGSWLFVDFFFVLSGFVIALAYLDRIIGAASFVVFVLRRVGRLWPVHAFMLLLFVASELVKATMHGAGAQVHALPFSGINSAAAIVGNLLLVHSLGFFDRPTWNGPSWSISVEFYTYMVFAALCLVARRWIVGASVAVICVAVLVLCLAGTSYLDVAMPLGLFRCCFGFFGGVLTFIAYRAMRQRSWRLPAATLLESIALAVVGLFVVVARDGGPLTMIAPAVFAAVVFVFAFEGGSWSGHLKRPLFVWLGDRSYSIYMVHWFVGDTIVRVLLAAGAIISLHIVSVASKAGDTAFTVSFGNAFVTDLYAALYMAATLVGAEFLHRFVERPGRACFNRIAALYPRRPAAETA